MAFHFGPPPIGPVVTNNLLLNLDAGNRFSYSGSGDIWYDVSGNNRNSTLGKTSTNYKPTWIQDRRGYFDFDASNSFGSGSFESQPFTNTVTLEAWVNHKRVTGTPLNSGGVQRYITTLWSGSDGEQCVLRTSAYLGIGCIHFYFVNNSGDPGYASYKQLWTAAGELQPNVWYHVVGTYDGTTSKIYKNGQLVISQNFGSNTIKSVSNNGYLIGASSIESMDGYIGQIRVYNRDLTATEVESNFNQSRYRYSI